MEMPRYIIKYVIEEDYPVCAALFYHTRGSIPAVGNKREKAPSSFNIGIECDEDTIRYRSTLREVQARITTYRERLCGTQGKMSG
jgi:hypothetical protein